MIRLNIDYGFAGCREDFDLEDVEDDWTDEEIEKYCIEFIQDEIWNKVSWEWERV